jgi:Co/Zn/Cd efflux system component
MSDNNDTPSPKENQQNSILLDRPTNERVLVCLYDIRLQRGKAANLNSPCVFHHSSLQCSAFVSFMGFAIAQTFAAIIAGSQAMVGDSAAMMVDAFTYLFNWYAERQKQGYVEQLKVQNGGMSKLLYRKYTYQLELVPPLFSVSTLIVVTVLVLKKAIHVLILDARRDRSQQTNPNLQLMILFSFLNLLLDVFNVFCFARAKHAVGYQTTMEEGMEEEDIDHVKTMRPLLSHDEYGSRGEKDIKGRSNRKTKTMVSLEIESSGLEDEADDHGSNPLCCQQSREDGSNLNMCSAYTVRRSHLASWSFP